MASATLLSCGVAACGSFDDDVVRVRSAIAGGSDAGSAENDGVVLTGSNAGIGTGALVARNLVLTTLSNLTPWAGNGFTCTADGEVENGGSGAGELGDPTAPELIKIWTGPTVELGANPEPSAVGRRIFATGTTTICRNDLAFLLLDRELDVGILPIRFDRGLEVGESVDIVGYGAEDRNHNTWDVLGHRRRRDDVRVEEVSVPPRTFVLGAGPCGGDGGGPALSSETGAVVGVFSFMTDFCDAELARKIYTEVAPFRELAREAFEAASAEPWIEGTSGPGAGGQGGAAGETGAGTDAMAGEAGAAGGSNSAGGEAGAPSVRPSPSPEDRTGKGCSLNAPSPRSSGAYPALLMLLCALAAGRRKVWLES